MNKNDLALPAYKSYDQLEKKFTLIIDDINEDFGENSLSNAKERSKLFHTIHIFVGKFLEMLNVQKDLLKQDWTSFPSVLS